ncbi:hypothetical protein J4209_05545 [Candidatus Woesearchaeota archaeon]|nr:hypothetical protein [Candidatus Woesearchaeota archaeon]
MDIRDKIIEFIRLKGPILPVQVSKEIGTDILMASAHLSELSSNKKVKISSVKIGGSPLYYLPGQEHLLQNFSSNLHEREKEAYALLNQKKILRDNIIEPVIRVALRAIKDFAIPLQVNYKGNQEIFWKWYLLPTKDAEELIKTQLKAIKEEPVKGEIEAKKPEIKREEQKPVKEIKKEEQKTIKEVKPAEVEDKKLRAAEKPLKDTFFNEIQNYFSKNKISVTEQKIIRKNAEISFIVEVPSSVGNLRYFCVAKSKKRISDGDLNSVYIQAQSKKLPVLFLTKGELTKKAKEILEKEFKGMSINKL